MNNTKKTLTHNGHNMVDIGTSVYWAETNLGAIEPQDMGHYYSLREIKEDPVKAAWGGKWRMPTIEELRQLDGCNYFRRMEVNGVQGFYIAHYTKDEGVFLPAAGVMYAQDDQNENSKVEYLGVTGYYWAAIDPKSGSIMKLGMDDTITDEYIYPCTMVVTAFEDEMIPIRPVCPKE